MRVSDAFRVLDVDKSGFIDAGEMREFFFQFNLKEEDADLFFDHLKEREDDSEIRFAQFLQRLGPVISPGSNSTRRSGDVEGAARGRGRGLQLKLDKIIRARHEILGGGRRRKRMT